MYKYEYVYYLNISSIYACLCVFIYTCIIYTEYTYIYKLQLIELTALFIVVNNIRSNNNSDYY